MECVCGREGVEVVGDVGGGRTVGAGIEDGRALRSDKTCRTNP